MTTIAEPRSRRVPAPRHAPTYKVRPVATEADIASAQEIIAERVSSEHGISWAPGDRRLVESVASAYRADHYPSVALLAYRRSGGIEDASGVILLSAAESDLLHVSATPSEGGLAIMGVFARRFPVSLSLTTGVGTREAAEAVQAVLMHAAAEYAQFVEEPLWVRTDAPGLPTASALRRRGFAATPDESSPILLRAVRS